MGWKQSKVDECVFFRGSVIFLVYVDDGIFLGPSDEDIRKAFDEIRNNGFNISDEGELDDYLGVKIQRGKDGHIYLTQPHLIQQIINDMV